MRRKIFKVRYIFKGAHSEIRLYGENRAGQKVLAGAVPFDRAELRERAGRRRLEGELESFGIPKLGQVTI